MKLTVLAVLLGVGAGAASAQDAHYWTRQYGPTETLLGGLVVGSAFDLSATFYNPGALALAEDPRFTFSLDAVELPLIEIPDGAGPDLDFRSRGLEFAPSFVAGQIGSGETNRFAFAALTRQDLSLRMGARRDTSTPTGAAFSGAVRIDQSAREYWAGGSWSRKLSPKLGFGVTTFLALRGQRTFSQITANAVEAEGEGSSVQLTDEFSYSHLRALWKLGLAYRPSDTWSAGVAVTTPGVGLFGSGKVDRQDALIAVDLDGDGREENEVASRLQTGLGARYDSPASIAFGLRYRWRSTAVDVTGEWFDAVDPFVTLEAEPVVSRPSGTLTDVSLKHSLRSVFNFGVGVEHRLSERTTLYGSVMRDASAAVSDPDINHSFATWDLTHLSAGIKLGEGRAAWTFGLGYAFGSDDLVRLFDLSGRRDPSSIGETPGSVEVLASRWKIIFGFRFGSS